MVSSVDGLAAAGLENRNVRFGSKADSRPEILMSALPLKADIRRVRWDIGSF
jgi:hypothetical protein